MYFVVSIYVRSFYSRGKGAADSLMKGRGAEVILAVHKTLHWHQVLSYLWNLY